MPSVEGMPVMFDELDARALRRPAWNVSQAKRSPSVSHNLLHCMIRRHGVSRAMRLRVSVPERHFVAGSVAEVERAPRC